MPAPRYGHTCLTTEVAGVRGVIVAGGALAGSQVSLAPALHLFPFLNFLNCQVDFLELGTGEWRQLPPLNYQVDGHKLVLVEGVPTMFSWENIEMFDGQEPVTCHQEERVCSKICFSFFLDGLVKVC